jgi:hypothetical protein
MVNTEGTRFSGRDKLIIIGTILAVALAIFVITRVVMIDRPHPVNEAPTNVVGTSAKANEMREEAARKGGVLAQPAGAGAGEDVMPAGAGKK